ncbi:dihydrofolate reductase [Hesseltinella vesiculosa]|uniref:Dihydrofolate reductase n=1 Tax=Hesseltinella vesiculosa TaxID=101127 RepID=A0A1X2GL10_9FUNG|nr:dihydrofolate reductase [Hesseltinella vesiculosa]
MTKFSIVVATTKDLGIGINGQLPWRLPKDMAFFKQVTSSVPSGSSRQNVVIMGRVTWESIPTKFRPLQDRFNIVISRNPNYDLQGASNTVLADSFDKALSLVDARQHERVFVIGGAHIYRLALESPQCAQLLLTRVHTHFDCDTFFPAIPSDFQLGSDQDLDAFVGSPVVHGIQTQKDIDFEFLLYSR